jgi:hypothetical protein
VVVAGRDSGSIAVIMNETCTVVPCFGDATGDEQVDVQDLVAVISAWGSKGPNAADINGDGVVDVSDLVAVVTNWGACL